MSHAHAGIVNWPGNWLYLGEEDLGMMMWAVRGVQLFHHASGHHFQQARTLPVHAACPVLPRVHRGLPICLFEKYIRSYFLYWLWLNKLGEHLYKTYIQNRSALLGNDRKRETSAQACLFLLVNITQPMKTSGHMLVNEHRGFQEYLAVSMSISIPR